MDIGAASTAGVGPGKKNMKYVSREGFSGPAKSRVVKRREVGRGGVMRDAG